MVVVVVVGGSRSSGGRGRGRCEVLDVTWM